MMQLRFSVIWATVLALAAPIAAQSFDPGKTGFSIRVDGVVSPYRVMTYSVLPGESFLVSIEGHKPTGEFTVEASSGTVTTNSGHSWTWVAPTNPGHCRLKISRLTPSPDSIILNLFVQVPHKQIKKGHLNGYRIGNYPKKAYKNLPQYLPPDGFIEVTEDMLELPISPHFQLGQFLCKQNGGYPKYVIIRPELLLKLELVLQKVNEKGFSCNSFHVMSGFRTPYYNKAIGNVKYSRHQWGGAADIFIDENPKDGMMDDLNGDRRIDWRDSAVLYELIDDMHRESWYKPFVGGLGRYRKTNNHGPFVHVDVRGFLARWGE